MTPEMFFAEIEHHYPGAYLGFVDGSCVYIFPNGDTNCLWAYNINVLKTVRSIEEFVSLNYTYTTIYTEFMIPDIV